MNYLSFKEVVGMYGLKDQATSIIKKQVLDQLTIAAEIYKRDDKFTTTAGVVNLHPTKGTHWVMFSDKFYFDSYGCPPPNNILNHINRGSYWRAAGLYSEYQIQKDDSYCAAYCLYVLYLTQIIGLKMQF